MDAPEAVNATGSPLQMEVSPLKVISGNEKI
jgi:hypothetical protein